MEPQRFYAEFKQGKRPKLAATPEDQPAHARTSQDLAQPATTFSTERIKTSSLGP